MSTQDNTQSTEKKNSKRAFDFARGNLFLCPPEDLVLITDEKHPLYDPRVKMPLNDDFVKSIMKRGVIKPVAVRKEGDKPVVLDGRQRVRAALKANEILRAQGASEVEMIKVPFVVRRPDDTEAMTIMVELNELASDDALGVKIEKATRLADRGATEEEIASSFGVQVATIKSWFKLRECHPKVREAVEAGRIRATDAVQKIAKLPREEQVAAIAKVAEENPTRAARKERGEKARKTATPASRLRRIAGARESLTIEARTVVDWIMGDATRENLFDRFPKLREALK